MDQNKENAMKKYVSQLRFKNLRLKRIYQLKNKKQLKKLLSESFMRWKSIVAIGNPERHERKASHCGSKQQ